MAFYGYSPREARKLRRTRFWNIVIPALVLAAAAFGGVCIYALTKEIWEY